MKKAPIPENDDERLEELYKYMVLDTVNERVRKLYSLSNEVLVLYANNCKV